MNPPSDRQPPVTEKSEPRWERAPSEREAFAAPEHDPRDIITPHAFRVSPALLGLSLATPRQRAMAIAIDGVLVAMLTNAGGVMLAAVGAVFVYGWLKNRYKPSGRIARGLSGPGRVLVALLIFSVAVSLLQPVWERFAGDDDDATPKKQGQLVHGANSLIVSAMRVALKSCDDAKCRTDAVEGVGAAMAEMDGTRDTKLAKIDKLIDKSITDEAERAQLKASAAAKMDQASEELAQKKAAGEKHAAAGDDGDDPDITALTSEGKAAKKDSDADHKPEYSLLQQLYGIADDLGLSVGWAAAYFTLFTTLWAGQTPGKKLMRIRVVHLSGKPISYWNSFGRFGGYAAGVTTGLLGFLQIYWDPNRQAIQDQVSFTAVIRDIESSAGQTPQPPSP